VANPWFAAGGQPVERGASQLDCVGAQGNCLGDVGAGPETAATSTKGVAPQAAQQGASWELSDPNMPLALVREIIGLLKNGCSRT